MRTRIAPTPSGFLHIGNAFNFLLTEKIVRRDGGQLILRIDDLDAPRIRTEYIADIFESIAWLALQQDDGPRDMKALELKFSQALRLPAYEELLSALVQTGMVFACTCSRKELAQHSQDGQYSGTCLHKNIPLDTPDVSWRICTPRETSTVTFEDKIGGHQTINLWEQQRHFIVRRRDGMPAYQIASLTDDVYYNIDTIVRGHDLMSSTCAQLYLAKLLGLSGFMAATFYHHPLIEDKEGGKLSKSAGSTSLRSLRGTGYSAERLRREFNEWAGIF